MRECRTPGIIPIEDADKIIAGLEQIKSEIDNLFSGGLEDIHMNIEARLTELTGRQARLHTGRNRNDQIATDERLYLVRNAANSISFCRKCRRLCCRLPNRTRQ